MLLTLANQWAHVQVHGRRAHAQRLKRFAQARQQGLVNKRINQHARTRRAGLPPVLHDGIDDDRDGSIQIGIGKNDLRAFAAQLQRHRAVALCRHLLDERANARAAGKADVVNARVACQRITHLVAVASDKVERAGRKAHLSRQLCHTNERQARVFGRFDYAHIARCECAAHAAAKNLQGVIPRNHMACDAVRLAPSEHAVAIGVGDGLAVKLVARTCVKLKVPGQRNRIRARLLGGLATVALL